MRAGRTVLLRADGGHAIGVGHLARVAGIAQALTAAGHRPVLMLGGDLDLVGAWCAAQGVAASLGAWDAAAVRTTATATAATAVVLDGQLVVRNLGSAFLGAGNPATFVVDDLGGVDLPVAAVINHNVGAEALAATYPRAEQRLLGRPYLILRRDILRHGHGACRPRPTGRRRVLITFGGSDPVGATARVMAALPATPALDVVVLCGPAFRDQAALQREASRLLAIGHDLEVVHGTSTPGDYVVRSDLALCAAGGTLGELAYLGCPALAFSIVPDQDMTARAQAAAGLVAGGARLTTLGDEPLRQQITGFLADDAGRAELRAAALASADGYGAARIVAALVA